MTRKLVLFSAGGTIALVAIAVAVLIFVLDVNAYKPQLEAAASRALGLQVHVDGAVGISIFPGVRITLGHVRIRNGTTDIASVEKASLGMDLLPLLHREVRLRSITLQQPRIAIERNATGTLAFKAPQAARDASPARNLETVSLRDATLVYTDRRSGGTFEASHCRLDVKHLRLPAGAHPDVLSQMSFTARLACKEARRNRFAVSNLQVSANAAKGIINLDPITVRLFGAQGSGRIRADLSGALPRYQIDYSLPQFRVEQFLETRVPQKVAEGPMDFSLELSMQGETARSLRQSADGRIGLRGHDLTIDGTDLDAAFTRFESSQEFDLLDAGAFFFAGPVGLVVTKGYNFAHLLQKSPGHSRIRKVVSEWKVRKGVAQAQDVAMATNKHRLALRGKLDFVHEQFVDVTVALIDAKGCVAVRQTIHGSFQKPEVEKPSVLNALAGPVLKLLEQGRDLFPGGECDVFYSGSVAPPR